MLPDRPSLGSVAPAVAELVRSGRIRVLDIVVLDRGLDGGLDVLEVGDIEDLVTLSMLEGDVGLLSENDLALASRGAAGRGGARRRGRGPLGEALDRCSRSPASASPCSAEAAVEDVGDDPGG